MEFFLLLVLEYNKEHKSKTVSIFMNYLFIFTQNKKLDTWSAS